MTKESIIQNIVKSIAQRCGYQLFRNNIGVAKIGNRFVRFGLAKGSGDLIGFLPYTVKPDDVGKTIAQFVSIEVKSEDGKLSKEQKEWRDMVQAAGGIAKVVSSAEDLINE